MTRGGVTNASSSGSAAVGGCGSRQRPVRRRPEPSAVFAEAKTSHRSRQERFPRLTKPSFPHPKAPFSSKARRSLPIHPKEPMGQSSTTLHENDLPPETVDRHRAIVSLMEELEAVDWYDQRVHAATDDELRNILAHNRDEEKEHACMMLEWLRRNDAGFAE